jgi:hypothetical protein
MRLVLGGRRSNGSFRPTFALKCGRVDRTLLRPYALTIVVVGVAWAGAMASRGVAPSLIPGCGLALAALSAGVMATESLDYPGSALAGGMRGGRGRMSEGSAGPSGI